MVLLLSALTVFARPPERAPRGAVAVVVDDVTPAGERHIVFLTDTPKTRVIPIKAGEGEAITIAFRLADRPVEPPLTHDVLNAVLMGLDATPHQVHIHSLEAGTFLARITVRSGRRRVHVEARASDAIAVAVGHGLPIFINQDLFESSSIAIDDLKKIMEEKRAGQPQL